MDTTVTIPTDTPPGLADGAAGSTTAPPSRPAAHRRAEPQRSGRLPTTPNPPAPPAGAPAPTSAPGAWTQRSTVKSYSSSQKSSSTPSSTLPPIGLRLHC